MEVLVIHWRGEVHHATQTDEYSSRGNRYIVCNCGAAGYGRESIVWAHNRGNPDQPVTIEYKVILKGWKRIWAPPWDTRQEKREHLSERWAYNGRESGRSARRDRLGERLLCLWYGHVPARDGRTCQYCQKRRGRRGRWNPMPVPEPLQMPTRPPRRPALPPASTVFAPPAILGNPYPTPPEHEPCSLPAARTCPICSRKRTR